MRQVAPDLHRLPCGCLCDGAPLAFAHFKTQLFAWLLSMTLCACIRCGMGPSRSYVLGTAAPCPGETPDRARKAQAPMSQGCIQHAQPRDVECNTNGQARNTQCYSTCSVPVPPHPVTCSHSRTGMRNPPPQHQALQPFRLVCLHTVVIECTIQLIQRCSPLVVVCHLAHND